MCRFTSNRRCLASRWTRIIVLLTCWAALLGMAGCQADSSTGAVVDTAGDTVGEPRDGGDGTPSPLDADGRGPDIPTGDGDTVQDCSPLCERDRCGPGPTSCGEFCVDIACIGFLALPGSAPPGFEEGFRYCSASSGTCASPEPDCEDGWCRLSAGAFVFGHEGRLEDEWGRLHFGGILNERPAVLTRAFVIGQTEVTQAEWLDVMETDVNPSPFPACGLDCPASGMSIWAMLAFANEKSRREGLAACYDLVSCSESPERWDLDCVDARFAGPNCEGYRLPSELEWEYAVRGGSLYCLPNGPRAGDPAGCDPDGSAAGAGWFCGNSTVAYDACVDLTDFGTHPERPACSGIHPVGHLAGVTGGHFS